MLRSSALARLFVFLLLLSGCSEAEVPPQAGKDEISIGVIGDFEGPELPLSSGIARGVALAVREYNSNPDASYRVSVTQVDTTGSAEGAAKAAQQLITKPQLIGVIGPFEAGQAEAAGDVFSEAGVPFLIPNVPSVTLPKPGWRGFRRLVASDRREGKLVGGALGGQGPVVLLHDGSPGGAGFVEGAAEAFAAKKRPIMRIEPVSGRSNIGAIVTGINNDKPEAVMYGGTSRTLMNLIAAVGKSTFKGPQGASSNLRAGRPPTGTASSLISSSPTPDLRDNRLKPFTAKFRGRFNAPPPPFAVEGYEGALMLLEAIQEVEPKPGELLEFLRLNRGFLGDSKRYEFTEEGEVRTAPVWLYQLRGNAWVYTGPASV